MTTITFFDTETTTETRKLKDIGGIKSDDSSFHSSSLEKFTEFLKGSEYICGHNIFRHDLKYVQEAIISAGLSEAN
ncbi:hypothetical protein ACFLWR_07210, partial [Chloroflexota bacterium]